MCEYCEKIKNYPELTEEQYNQAIATMIRDKGQEEIDQREKERVER